MTIEQTEASGLILGSPVPRIHTQWADLPSKGQDIIDLANQLEMPLMPWQAYVAHHSSKIKADNRWAYPTVGILVARQSGKSHFMRMRILAGLVLWGEELQIGAAHKLHISLEHFNQVVEILENFDWLGKQVKRIRRVNGQEEITMLGGQRFKVVANNSAGRGFAKAETVYLDELREHKDYNAWASITKTQLAAKNPQIFALSNAGDSTAIVLNTLRERALASIANTGDNIGWFEWSAPAGSKIDIEAIQQSNPALGHTIHIDNILSTLNEPEAIIRTEVLCQFLDTIQSPFPPDAWSKCANRQMELGDGETFAAFDINPRRTEAALVLGQVLKEGKIGLAMVETYHSETALDDLVVAGKIAEWVKQHEVNQIAYSKNTGSNIASRLTAAGLNTIAIDGRQFATACDDLLSAMSNGRLEHADQIEFNKHISSSARMPFADGGWFIGRRASNANVTGAVAAAMVCHLAVQQLAEIDILVA